MRIPLDYYQILSVPVRATADQIEQAYNDRFLQQPRREYNEQAIQARQELIQYAYQVLSDIDQRAKYDAQFFVNMQSVKVGVLPDTIKAERKTAEAVGGTEENSSESTPEALIDENPPQVSPPVVPVVNPTIEVASSQLIGALLILHELGEYQLALQLGVDYFNSPEFIKPQQEEDIRTDAQENIILSLTLAYLELGREQWHRREYENAAASSQMGIDLLERENLFPHIKEELELDLYKLRPYRVLELISQNKANSSERAKGFKLLREMLLQRQGIEGRGQDRSGLNFDQFLCFIQQLRTYLTSVEQQELFDHESQNNSAIANYLAVYALLGRGFSLKQPELILRAQRKLDYLSEKQDVAWEQAVSALLLGHTEKAIDKLQNSQDTAKLEQIQQHSAPNIDLLSGMCLYGEKWLHEDVIAQFSDLATGGLTLKEYFADYEVQNYLEELSSNATLTTPKTHSLSSIGSNSSVSHHEQPIDNSMGILSRWRSMFASGKTKSNKKKADKKKVASPSRKIAQPEKELVGVTGSNFQNNSSKTSASQVYPSHRHQVSPARNKPRFQQTVPHNPQSQSQFQSFSLTGPKSASKPSPKSSPKSSSKSPSLPLESGHRAVPPAVIQKANGKVRQNRVARKKKLKSATVWKGWLFIFSLMAGFGALAFIAMKLFLNPDVKTADKSQLAIAVSEPTVEVSTVKPPKPKPEVVKPKLTFADQSQKVVAKWLGSKSAAFGKEHQIDQLNSILAEPLLTTWRDRAQAHLQSNSYREYNHKITMRSAEIDPNNPQKATVEAEVKEVAKHYQAGQLDSAQSYDDNLLVRYQLILQEDKWLIQSAEVLQTL